MPVGIVRTRRRVDQPATRRAHLHEAELGDVARHGGLHDLEAGVAKRVGKLALRRDGLVSGRVEDRVLSVSALHSMRDSSKVCATRGLLPEWRAPPRLRSNRGQRRCDPDDVLAGAQDEQAALAAAGDDLPAEPVDDRAEEEASTAHLADAGERL